MQRELVEKGLNLYQSSNNFPNSLPSSNHTFSFQKILPTLDKGNSSCHSIRQVTKEEFFNTKRPQKRMKTSFCFSETQYTNYHQRIDSDSTMFSIHNEQTTSSSNKDLDSTLADDLALAFKVKQPKRKINCNFTSQTSGKQESHLENKHLHRSPSPKLKLHTAQKRPYSNSLSRSAQNTCHDQKKKKECRLSDFVLLRKIGQGSYCEVFKAVQKKSGFICALKVMNKQKMKELQMQKNIKRELKIALFSDHPNITKLYSFFWDRDNIYLISEYATDRNLFQYLYEPKMKLKKGLRDEEAANFTRQICSAISHLHSHSIIHRDLKPENILITIFDNIKICDFGWSVYNPSKELRSTFCGTPLYLAPELISQNQYDQSIDIWAIGVIAYEMLTEEIPFKIQKPNDLRKILFEQVRLEKINNKLASDFVERAMRKDASKRVTIGQLLHHPFVN